MNSQAPFMVFSFALMIPLTWISLVFMFDKAGILEVLIPVTNTVHIMQFDSYILV